MFLFWITMLDYVSLNIKDCVSGDGNLLFHVFNLIQHSLLSSLWIIRVFQQGFKQIYHPHTDFWCSFFRSPCYIMWLWTSKIVQMVMVIYCFIYLIWYSIHCYHHCELLEPFSKVLNKYITHIQPFDGTILDHHARLCGFEHQKLCKWWW